MAQSFNNYNVQGNQWSHSQQGNWNQGPAVNQRMPGPPMGNPGGYPGQQKNVSAAPNGPIQNGYSQAPNPTYGPPPTSQQRGGQPQQMNNMTKQMQAMSVGSTSAAGPPMSQVMSPPQHSQHLPPSTGPLSASHPSYTHPPMPQTSSHPGAMIAPPTSSMQTAPRMQAGGGAPPMGMPPSSGYPGMPTQPMSQHAAQPPRSYANMSGPPSNQGPSPMRPPGPGQPPMPGTNYSQPGMAQPNYATGPMGQPTVGAPGRPGPMPGGMPGQPPMQQPAKRIDPTQMPNPIQVMKDDVDAWKSQSFQSSVRGKLPPLVTTKCRLQDDGNCSPRYMRSTMYNVPCNQDMLKESSMPLALVLTPFAKVPEEEGGLHIVNHGAKGPVRCNRCKTYMNPFMQFIDGGRRFVCNVCSHSSEVPAEYFCHLDHQGRRVDLYERPELCFGAYEFIATTDYCKEEKFPSPPAFIFMIDVSYQSMQCGMVHLLTRELHDLLDHLPKEAGCPESVVKVGFVTYSNHLHFFNVKENLVQPQMMVVSDVNDVFVPLLDGFLVNMKEARIVVDSLLDLIPELFANTRETDVVLGPVVQAGMLALKDAGISGKLFVFHSSLPIAEAPGKLKNREDRKLLATDKEKTILAPQSTFYVNLAKECVACGVSVDLFLFPNAYVDVATIGLMVTQTGGQIYRYSYFKEATHGRQFVEDLRKNFGRNVGFDALMRVRCSTGLRPVEFYGSFLMTNTTDVELASIDSDKAIAIEIKHDDKIPEDGVAFAQCALLYTSVGGQRRLRILNLSFSCCSQLADLYRCCELDTLMNFMMKHSLRQVLSSTPQAIRESLSQRCAQVLACYRQHCASPSTSGQLILPECMKLLPLYTNCLTKSDVLAGGSEMSSDDRAFLMQVVLSMPTTATVPYLYPRLFALHALDSNSASMPQQMRCYADQLHDTGIYLLENGISMFVWIGLQASPDLLQQLFNVATIGQVDIEMTSLPEVDTPLSKQVRDIISQIQSERQRYLKLTIVRQRDKLEPWFKHYLMEDKGLHLQLPSYVDYLCQVHKDIRNLLM